MMRLISMLLAVLLLQQVTFPLVTGQSLARKDVHLSESTTIPIVALTNQDVLILAKVKLAPEVIVAKIKTSRCAFEVSETGIQELKIAGVPNEVITAMIEAVRPSTARPPGSSQLGRIGPLQIPDGTLIEVESPYRVNSQEFKPSDEISFRVINPIKINGVTVIEQGANVTGRIEKAKRGGHFGKAGLLVWSMQTVTAVDGSQVPLRAVQERLRGDSKAAKVATQMVVTGALLFWIAPVALLHGFKRGEDAFIPAGKRYDVFVNGQALIQVR